MVGLIAFANDGGIGAQTRRLAKLINPDKIMVIDSTGFSPNKEFHPEWYPAEKSTIVKGFPKNYDILEWIEGLTHVIAVENPYNFYLVKACQERGIKTIIQTNYEFCENLQAPWLPIPSLFLMPSHWMVADMEKRFGKDKVMYLPPPIYPEEFAQAREKNLKQRKGKTRLLHIVGTLAFQDRNGTLDLLRAVQLSRKDYKLVIRSQHPLPPQYLLQDPRIEYRVGNVKNNQDLYHNFDALILPRRYGGLSLTTNEAMMSGLPVMMPNISPNNEWLPKDWLTPTKMKKTFVARAVIDCYLNDVHKLAKQIDLWAQCPPLPSEAIEIAEREFSPEVLKPKYDALFE